MGNNKQCCIECWTFGAFSGNHPCTSMTNAISTFFDGTICLTSARNLVWKNGQTPRCFESTPALCLSRLTAHSTHFANLMALNCIVQCLSNTTFPLSTSIVTATTSLECESSIKPHHTLDLTLVYCKFQSPWWYESEHEPSGKFTPPMCYESPDVSCDCSGAVHYTLACSYIRLFLFQNNLCPNTTMVVFFCIV